MFDIIYPIFVKSSIPILNIFYNDLEVSKRKAILLFNDLKESLSNVTEEIYAERVKRIVEKSEPFEYVTGFTYFEDIKIFTESPILIPRQDTLFGCDILEKYIIKFNLDTKNILDLCTGSGCVALWLSKKYKNSFVDASDIDLFALKLAKKNIIFHSLKEKIFVIQSNLFENINKKYNIIFSNPPYISLKEYKNLDSSVKNWESKIALTDNKNGMSIIKKIILASPQYLINNGVLFIEIDSSYSENLFEWIKNKNLYKNIELLKDINNNYRYILLNK